MGEKEFAQKIKNALEKKFKDYTILTDANLLYKVIVDENMNFSPANPEEPKRGNLAFQIDLLIKKGNLPLVAIETKYDNFSTHDVLIYSTKALKHKGIYPYLRYGFVVRNASVITNKFFTHNQGFDFALVVNEDSDLKSLISVIEKQLENAEDFLEILKEKNKVKLFSLNMEIMWK